ncbi:hypothetical protein EBZ39_00505 [bacterium]|nr:hypothetical protein [bacterium]
MHVTSIGEWLKTTKQKPMVQSVFLEFSDGTTAAFSGPAVMFDETKEVTKVTFSTPRALPEDCMWSSV